MTALVVLTVLEVVVLIAALAFYLFWVGTLLARIAGNLEECAGIVRDIVSDAALIGPGVVGRRRAVRRLRSVTDRRPAWPSVVRPLDRLR